MTIFTSLYDLLGVPIDATQADIHKAYKRKAKKAHPDAGGTAEAFQKLAQAYEILGDEKRRAQYDKSGFTGEAQPDNSLTQIYSEIGEQLGKVLNEHAAVGQDCEAFDVLDATAQKFRIRIAERDNKIEQMERTIAKYRKVAKRTKTKKKDGQNVLRMLFEARAATGANMVKELREHNAMDQKAIDLLLSHEYEFDQPTQMHISNFYRTVL